MVGQPTSDHETAARPSSESEVTLAQLMLPTDANPWGNVHGGTIMKLADTAAGIAATRHARSRAVTAFVDSMSFLHPVYVGNLVTLKARVTWTGRTSLEVEVTVDAEDVTTGEITHTSTALFVYVALDDAGQPVVVPPLRLETEEDRKRWQEAAARQERRAAERSRHQSPSRRNRLTS